MPEKTTDKQYNDKKDMNIVEKENKGKTSKVSYGSIKTKSDTEKSKASSYNSIKNKSDFEKELAKLTGITIQQSKNYLTHLFKKIAENVKMGNKVVFVGSMIIYPVKQNRAVRNPNYREGQNPEQPKYVEPKYPIRIKIKAGQTFKDIVNHKIPSSSEEEDE